jgi:hypothetical protein
MSEKTMYIYALAIIAFIILMIFVGVIYNKSRRVESFSNKTPDGDKTDPTKKPAQKPLTKPSYEKETKPMFNKGKETKPFLNQFKKETKPSYEKETKPLFNKEEETKPIRQPRQNQKCENKYMKENIDICLKNNDELKNHLHEMIKKLDEDSDQIKENIKIGDLKCNRIRI